MRPYAGESFPFFDPPWINHPECPGRAYPCTLCARGKQSLSYFLQQAFQTAPLSGEDWLLCLGVGSTVLWLREIVKLFGRLLKRR